MGSFGQSFRKKGEVRCRRSRDDHVVKTSNAAMVCFEPGSQARDLSAPEKSGVAAEFIQPGIRYQGLQKGRSLLYQEKWKLSPEKRSDRHLLVK
jgi:hypothetical protein